MNDMRQTHQPIAGIYVAPVTPMRDNLSLDLAQLARVVDFLVTAGVHGLTPCAVTAETEALTVEEHQEVLRTTMETAAGRVPVFLGVGRPSFTETLALVEWAERLSPAGLFVITPFCNGYTLDEVLAYYELLTARTALPIMMYNCPSYSGVNIAPAAAARLARRPTIVATKEGNQAQLHLTVDAVRSDMAVLTARDTYLIESMAVGATGLVSFAANVAPQLVVRIYNACVRNDWETARELQKALVPLVMALVSRSYPTMIKAAMGVAGMAVGQPRRVPTRLSAEESELLYRTVRNALAAEATALAATA